jgi:hypothetical protein
MRLDELTDDAIDYILENVNTSRGSKWEQDFVDSIADQWTRRRHLTDRQKEVWGRYGTSSHDTG